MKKKIYIINKAVIIFTALIFSLSGNLMSQSKYVEFEKLFFTKRDTMNIPQYESHLKKLKKLNSNFEFSFLSSFKKYCKEGDTLTGLKYLAKNIEIGYTYEEFQEDFENANNETFQNFWLLYKDSITLKINLNFYLKIKEMFWQDKYERENWSLEDSNELKLMEHNDLARVRTLLYEIFPKYGILSDNIHGRYTFFYITIIMRHNMFSYSKTDFLQLKKCLFEGVSQYKIPISYYCYLIDNYLWKHKKVSKYGGKLDFVYFDEKEHEEYTKYVKKNKEKINKNRTSIGHKKLE